MKLLNIFKTAICSFLDSILFIFHYDIHGGIWLRIYAGSQSNSIIPFHHLFLSNPFSQMLNSSYHPSTPRVIYNSQIVQKVSRNLHIAAIDIFSKFVATVFYGGKFQICHPLCEKHFSSSQSQMFHLKQWECDPFPHSLHSAYKSE